MHATFTLMRYIDDVAFHADVRPRLIAGLDAQASPITPTCCRTQQRAPHRKTAALLWPAGLALLAQIAPEFRDAGFTITLPWDRTFETEIDLRLQPR